MGNCSSLLGLCLGLVAVALGVFTNKATWYPASDLGEIMQEIFPLTFYVRTLPITATTFCCLSVACLLKDFTSDKITFRVVAILGFLFSCFCMCLGGGFFLYKIGEITTKIHLKTLEYEEKMAELESASQEELNKMDSKKAKSLMRKANLTDHEIYSQVLTESLWEMYHDKDSDEGQENFLNILESKLGLVGD